MRKIIKICDVSARDGLQSLSKIISFNDKKKLIDDLIKCKFDEIEVGSIINYNIIPSMKYSIELYNKLKEENNNDNFFLLVGNEKGIDITNNNLVKNISFFTSSSNTFNKNNINLDTDNSFDRIKRMIDKVKDRENVKIKGYLSCIGSCPFEGDVKVNDIINSVNKFNEIGVDEICLADTLGDLKKEKLENILINVINLMDSDKLSIHLHTNLNDYYWKENLKIALKYNILRYDTSILNIGGCPAIYKKDNCKLNGNLNIVKAYSFFKDEGYELGINIQAVKEIEKKWENILI